MKKIMRCFTSVTLAVIMVFGMGFTTYASEFPSVDFSEEIREYNEYMIGGQERGLSIPSQLWDWSNGEYEINGSSSGRKIYTEYCFTDVVGRELTITAGGSSRIMIEMRYSGFWQDTTVSAWTIDAGETKTITIQKSDLDGHSETGNYYFGVETNPPGSSYTTSGSFK